MIEKKIPILQINQLSVEQFDRANAAGALQKDAIYLTPSNDETIYYIDCYATIANGVYTSVEMGDTGGKSLADILSEAAIAHTHSRLIVLRDLNTGTCLTGLVALKPTTSLMFDVPQENLNIKNIIQFDTNGFTCYSMQLQSKMTVENALNQNSNNPISSKAVYSALEEYRNSLLNVINGKVDTHTFSTSAELTTLINDAEMFAEYQDVSGKTFKTGDVILIRDELEPDYWWESRETSFMLLESYDDRDIEGLLGFARVLEARSIDIEKVNEIDNRLDGLSFKQTYEYAEGNTLPNGSYEYDPGNDKLYLWVSGSRVEQPIDPNTIYITREV